MNPAGSVLPPLHPTACQGRCCAALLSVGWHGLMLLAMAALSQCALREAPQLLVHDIILVQERISEAPAVSPNPPVPVPVAPAAAPIRSMEKPLKAVTKSAVGRSGPAVVPVAVPDTIAPETPVGPQAAQDQGGAMAATLSAATTTGPTPSINTAPGFEMGHVDTPVPAYPASARKRRRQGVLLVQLDVNAEGRVDHAVLLESSGDASLDDAALSTLGRWVLRPATENGRPVPGRVEVPVRFRLE